MSETQTGETISCEACGRELQVPWSDPLTEPTDELESFALLSPEEDDETEAPALPVEEDPIDAASISDSDSSDDHSGLGFGIETTEEEHIPNADEVGAIETFEEELILEADDVGAEDLEEPVKPGPPPLPTATEKASPPPLPTQKAGPPPLPSPKQQPPPLPVAAEEENTAETKKSLFSRVGEVVKKATGGDKVCSECSEEIGILGLNFAKQLPENVAGDREAVCANCLPAIDIPCAYCGEVWYLKAELPAQGCPSCHVSRKLEDSITDDVDEFRDTNSWMMLWFRVGGFKDDLKPSLQLRLTEEPDGRKAFYLDAFVQGKPNLGKGKEVTFRDGPSLLLKLDRKVFPLTATYTNYEEELPKETGQNSSLNRFFQRGSFQQNVQDALDPFKRTVAARAVYPLPAELLLKLAECKEELKFRLVTVEQGEVDFSVSNKDFRPAALLFAHRFDAEQRADAESFTADEEADELFVEEVELFEPEPEPPTPAQSDSPLELIKQLKELHDAGILSDEEFQEKKTELLKRL